MAAGTSSNIVPTHLVVYTRDYNRISKVVLIKPNRRLNHVSNKNPLLCIDYMEARVERHFPLPQGPTTTR